MRNILDPVLLLKCNNKNTYKKNLSIFIFNILGIINELSKL